MCGKLRLDALRERGWTNVTLDSIHHLVVRSNNDGRRVPLNLQLGDKFWLVLAIDVDGLKVFCH